MVSINYEMRGNIRNIFPCISKFSFIWYGQANEKHEIDHVDQIVYALMLMNQEAWPKIELCDIHFSYTYILKKHMYENFLHQ